jgi:hypothetical protein
MQLFRFALLVAWLATLWVSVRAILAMGAGAAGDVFLGDFSHPWRAQFNTDFSVHLLLMAAWIVYREGRSIRGFGFGLAAILFGGAFSFAYFFVATFTAKGDVRRLLLGRVDSIADAM